MAWLHGDGSRASCMVLDSGLAPLPDPAGPQSQVCPPSWVGGDPSLLPGNCWLLLITAAPSMSLLPAGGVPRAWFADRKPRAGISAGVTSCPSPGPAVAAPRASPLVASVGAGEWAVDQPWSSLKQINVQYFVMAFSSPTSAPICSPRTRLRMSAQRARARGEVVFMCLSIFFLLPCMRHAESFSSILCCLSWLLPWEDVGVIHVL